MKRLIIEIVGRDARIEAKGCAKLDELIALHALLKRVTNEGMSLSYVERYLGVKFDAKKASS